MIVNHRHRFVFVHIPKTGGSSIAAALCSVKGSKVNPKARTKHLTSEEFLSRLHWWQMGVRDYRFFAFVRNPWDRLVSLHRYLLKTHKHLPVPESFSDFMQIVREGEPWVMRLHSIRPQSDFLPDNPFMIGHYEHLHEDFARLCDGLGLSLSLPHLNASGKQGDYRACFGDDDAELVARMYQVDIERFGYSFLRRGAGGGT